MKAADAKALKEAADERLVEQTQLASTAEESRIGDEENFNGAHPNSNEFITLKNWLY